ncbi:extracellular solute-binding protein [Sodalis sp. RH21]|uniref:extracellular solute-binding protein n=1 Tax=unclassified Sodalis (in: enterobacteria) TaxID=2636512 RepID=UPI0039B4C676
MNRKYIGAMVMCALGAFSSLNAAAAEDIRVTYAGSMGVVMDKYLGPTFAKNEHLTYQGQGQGAYGMARLLASKKIVADVFVSITPGPMDILKQAGMVDEAVPVASTRMVIVYNPKSAFAPAFVAAKNARPGDKTTAPWWKVLQSPGLAFGRTDPVNDPQGQNIIFTMKLAEKYYRQPGLAQKVLGEVQNPKQVFAEGGLLTRMESGQVDASSGYESATISAKLPYITLPDEINLSNPAMSADWYDKVSFAVKDATGQEKTLHTQPLVFYAAVLKNAPDAAEGRKFVAFLQSKAGQALLAQNGYGQPKGGALYH